MKISFVIPAYNEEAYIGKCLESILRETKCGLCEYEVIVVNNASTDKTKEEAAKFPGVKIVDESRKGLPWARQAGFMAATGDLIANVDADNIIPAGWQKEVVDEFTSHSTMVGLSGPVVYYDLPRSINWQVKVFYGLGYVTYLINHFVLRKGGMLQGGNFVIKKSALEQVGGFNTDISFYGEDTDIARRLQKTGYIKFTFDLPMFSSGRRLKKEGVYTLGFRYALNYFWILFLKRPYSDEYQDLTKN